MPDTWVAISREMAGKVLHQNELNEEYVATLKIQKLLNEGYSERQVALIWNGSLGGSEKPVEKKGINSRGVKYDTKLYASLVLTAYAAEK